jgi:hypothetical protein
VNPTYVRIALRYLAGYLVLKGLLPQEIATMIENDPELAGAVGALIAIAVEGAYAFARRMGWRT